MGWELARERGCVRVNIQANQNQVRTVLKLGGLDTFRRAQKERARFVAKLRRIHRRAKASAEYRRWRLANPERVATNKRRWRLANRERVNAYYRRYDALTPGRREYKARKAREYRARAAQAAASS